MEIIINSEEFWVKIVDFAQQNWALIEIEHPSEKANVYFIDDGSHVFDKIEFDSLKKAEWGLMRNGFRKYLDKTKDYGSFMAPPKRPFIEKPRNIYSSGEYWL